MDGDFGLQSQFCGGRRMAQFSRVRPPWRRSFALLVSVWIACQCTRLIAAENEAVQGDAEAVSQTIRRASQLPGGESLRPLADAPLIVWGGLADLYVDNAYSGTGVHYLALRLTIANRTEQDLQLSRSKITLQ